MNKILNLKQRPVKAKHSINGHSYRKGQTNIKGIEQTTLSILDKTQNDNSGQKWPISYYLNGHKFVKHDRIR